MNRTTVLCDGITEESDVAAVFQRCWQRVSSGLAAVGNRQNPPQEANK